MQIPTMFVIHKATGNKMLINVADFDPAVHVDPAKASEKVAAVATPAPEPVARVVPVVKPVSREAQAPAAPKPVNAKARALAAPKAKE